MQEPPEAGQPSPTPIDATAASGALEFEETYFRYAPLLRKIAIRKFHVPPADAETLVHDIFATYLMHASSVRNLEPYLIGSICNASLQYLRGGDDAEELSCGETPCRATPDDELLREVDLQRRLSRVLTAMDAPCRDLLRRYYLGRETTQAIAESLESTPESILALLLQCRKRVQAAMGLRGLASDERGSRAR